MPSHEQPSVDVRLEQFGASPRAIDGLLGKMPITGDEKEVGVQPQYGEAAFKDVMVWAVKRHLLLQLSQGQIPEGPDVNQAGVLLQGLLHEAVQNNWEGWPDNLQPDDKLVITVADLQDNRFIDKVLGLTRGLKNDIRDYWGSGYKDKALTKDDFRDYWRSGNKDRPSRMVRERIGATGRIMDELAESLAGKMIKLKAHKREYDAKRFFQKNLEGGTLVDHLQMAWTYKKQKESELEHQAQIDYMVAHRTWDIPGENINR